MKTHDYLASIETAFDAVPDGLAILNAAGQIQVANVPFAFLLGLQKEQLPGLTLEELQQRTSVDLGDLIAKARVGRKSELLLNFGQGQFILTSLRRIGKSNSDEASILLSFRDLAVIDHEREKAGGSGNRKSFQLLSHQKTRPDLMHQRRISPLLEKLLTIGERAMLQDARILLLGESGAGKTEISRYLHSYISSENAPFIHVNCGAIPDSLFESEMFGYERGSFTGALQTGKKGLIEAADGGTLFLDEVGEIPLVMQAKMLKFLETGTVQRVGGASERNVKVRIITATNRDLFAMVNEGTFRRDLYYRLAVVPLHVPALRESKQMVKELLEYFVTVINQKRDTPLIISDDCKRFLMEYSYPGNIRELQNIVQQLSVMAADVAGPEHLPDFVLREHGSNTMATHEGGDLKSRVTRYELGLINEAITRLGSKRKAAEELGVDIGTIVRKTQVTPK